VEVVIALGILLILMIGVLQMFSMAYLTNLNAAAGTELTSKAQQTAEVLRWALYQEAYGSTVGVAPNALPVSALTGAPAPTGIAYTLPDTSSGANWNFWGPSGVGVQTRPSPPYTITYTVEDNGGASKTVTVRVRAKTTGSNKYVGVAKQGKVVEYVVQAPKAGP
jgi:hypothetical protein